MGSHNKKHTIFWEIEIDKNVKGYYQINNSLSFFPYYGEVGSCQIILFLANLHHIHTNANKTHRGTISKLEEKAQKINYLYIKKKQVLQIVLEVYPLPTLVHQISRIPIWSWRIQSIILSKKVPIDIFVAVQAKGSLFIERWPEWLVSLNISAC